MSNGKKIKSVVGLIYDGKRTHTLIVSVKEEAALAEQVIKIAKRFGVPIIEKSDLVKAMYPLELDQEIPAELFEAVALVLNEIERKT